MSNLPSWAKQPANLPKLRAGGEGRPVTARPTQYVRFPSQTAGIQPATLVWVSMAPCGCAWGWALDRAPLSGADRAELMLAERAELELHHTLVHHVSDGAFHHEHRPIPGHAH